jgi:hypothetical protein
MFAFPLFFEPNISCLWCQVLSVLSDIVFNDVIKFNEKFSFEKTVLFENCYFLVQLRNFKTI